MNLGQCARFLRRSRQAWSRSKGLGPTHCCLAAKLIKALVSSLLAAANSGEIDPEKFRAIALNWARAHFPDEGIDLDLRVLDHWRRTSRAALSSRKPS